MNVYGGDVPYPPRAKSEKQEARSGGRQSRWRREHAPLRVEGLRVGWTHRIGGEGERGK